MPEEAKIYVGNLPDSASNEDIHDLFNQFGKLSYIDFKYGKSARFAFVGFRDCRGADNAVKQLHDKDYRGRRLKVQHPFGVGPRGWGGKPLSDINDKHTRVGRGPGGPQRRTDYRVFVDGIPKTGSWQDLKDYLRPAGVVCYAMVSPNRTGIVEFEEEISVQKSIDLFDKTEFVSHLDERGFIRVSDYSSMKTIEDFRFCSRSRSSSSFRSHSQPLPCLPSYSQSPSHSSFCSRSPYFRNCTPSPSPSPSPSRKRLSSFESLQTDYQFINKRRSRSRFSTQSL